MIFFIRLFSLCIILSFMIAQGNQSNQRGFIQNEFINGAILDSAVKQRRHLVEKDYKNVSNTVQRPGPSTPEVQRFTAHDVTELVDPFTGDFSYSIPLMDVEGYPITITYNSLVCV